jgi:hypothetical protein
MSALWNVFRVTVAIAMIGMVVLYALTFWAIDKSRERAECYRHATNMSQCEQPGLIESAIRWIGQP